MKNSLKSEILKFLSDQWICISGLATVILTPLLIAFLHGTPTIVSKDYILTQVIESYYLGQAGMLTVSILYIGREFVNNTLRTTFLTTSKRGKVIFSKIAVLLLFIMIMWISILFLSIGVIRLYYGVLLVYPIIKLSIMIIIESISLVLLGMSMVILSKSIIFSLGLSLSFLLGLGQLLLQFSKLFLYFPINSTMNLFFLNDNPIFLTSIHGVLVQIMWSVTSLVIAIIIIMNRSVR